MSCNSSSSEPQPELDPELYEPINDHDRREIWKEPLDHEEELEMEGATIYDFDGGRGEDDWHNTNKSKDEIEKICKRNDAGALIMKPCVHTNYIEFRLEPPSGFAKECTCNECWNKFWIAPFSEPAECPYCHVRSINIASREYIGDGES